MPAGGHGLADITPSESFWVGDADPGWWCQGLAGEIPAAAGGAVVSVPGERVEAVTTSRSYVSWHLSPANAGRSAPRFRGELSRDRVLIAQLEDASGRNSYTTWLEARMEPAAGGGTTLTGNAGLRTPVRSLMLIISGVVGLIALGPFVAGLIQAASGNLSGLTPAALAPVGASVILAIVAGASRLGLRSLEREIPRLLQEVNSVLGSTAAIPEHAPPQTEDPAA